jgi:hypothetical protein
MAAVEEPVERFYGDRHVRLPIPPAMPGELPQNPHRDFEPVSAGPAHSNQVGDQALERALTRHALPP